MHLGHLNVVLNFDIVTSVVGPWKKVLCKCLLLLFIIIIQ